MSSPSVSASPIRSVPRLGMPTTSPAYASSTSERSCAKKNCGVCSAITFPVRTCFAFMPRVRRPEQTRMNAMRSRWLGSMFAWILKMIPVISGSVATTVRVAALRLSGGGAKDTSASRRSRTPKFLSALPK